MFLMGVLLTGCEPMEDIHEEVDQRIENTPIEGVTEYILTEEDYDDLDLPNQFSSLEEASALIPQLLSDMFPVWGNGSLAQVTFNLNAPNTPDVFEVPEAGYEAIGLNRNYFNETSEIKEYLEYQFPQASLNEYIKLTYRTVAVEKSYELSDDDFDLIEEEFKAVYPDPAASAGRFGNFERREGRDAYWTNEMILEAINVVMAKNFPGVEGQTYEVTYPIYNGSPGMESMKLRYNGTAYVQFGATAYDMSDDDFDFVGAELAEEYPGPAANAAQFHSFDIRATSDNYWNEEMILEAINVLLMERSPNATEGIKFNVSYRVYDGSGVSSTVLAVVLSDGEYVLNEEETISTIMESKVFAFGDNMWHMPLTLPDGIYQNEFGQRFGNFGNEADAGFYIGRWLEPRFPYAQDRDFVSVGYTFTFVVEENEKEVRKFETRYASFVYDEDQREWEFIPTVIPYTVQFGIENGEWVVDNTIVYQLASSDYEFLSEYFTGVQGFEDQSWSIGNYQNFDRRQGTRNYWSTDMLIRAMGVLLNEEVAPGAEEGQKYLMIYDIYDGTNTTEQLHLIKTEGEWVPVS